MPQTDPEARRVYFRKWYAKNKVRWRAHVKAYRDANRDKYKHNPRKYDEKYKLAKFARIYKLTIDEVKFWLAITSCEICGRSETVVMDHDHVTGVFRGRLCDRCNTGLGMFGDNPDTLETAAKYLRDRTEKKL